MRRLSLVLTCLLVACAGADIRPRTDAERVYGFADATAALVMRDDDLTPWPYCSGVWISERMIVTASHCVKDKDEVEYSVFSAVTETNAFPYALAAQVVGRDEKADLAVLVALDRDVPTHAIARLTNRVPRVGERLHVMGHTLGLPWSYSPAWVGALREGALDREGSYLQVFSALGPGNSGGGVFNDQGELVGIALFVAVSVPQLGFAARAEVVRGFLAPYL